MCSPARFWANDVGSFDTNPEDSAQSNWLAYYLRMKKTEVIVLAAGKGTRMRSNEPKVLQMLGGRSLLDHVLAAVRGAIPSRIYVVYGHGGDAVRRSESGDDINWVQQEPQLGTGHAVSKVMPSIDPAADALAVKIYVHPFDFGAKDILHLETVLSTNDAVVQDTVCVPPDVVPTAYS